MKTSDISKGTKVVLPDGSKGTVTSVGKEETGRKGRPATLFTVKGAQYRASDLKPAPVKASASTESTETVSA